LLNKKLELTPQRLATYAHNLQEKHLNPNRLLLTAIDQNSIQKVWFILSLPKVGMPVDVNIRDSYGNTALILAIKNGVGVKDMVGLLINSGADLNLLDSNGNTALMVVEKELLSGQQRQSKLLAEREEVAKFISPEEEDMPFVAMGRGAPQRFYVQKEKELKEQLAENNNYIQRKQELIRILDDARKKQLSSSSIQF
jgi:Ankyrin repeats (3 copies)